MTFSMTNSELVAAIEYAYVRTSNGTERGKIMLKHLADLCAIQKKRAELVQPEEQESK